ncbi:hypothetical protein PVAND_017666 [Polypedilum vanderplanki]|uniref:H15 domain-containing protein n=1 Tax=Polypedilum vanderplanki TaxID=319348 RepID=A0A9J6B8Y7_POLVA|nr:hypothetical protein PVAND_017666 [Polypedilum vanderplanki]
MILIILLKQETFSVNKTKANIKERGGSSLQAIKKFVSAQYKVDVEKLAPFIKKYLKSAVTKGQLVQTKGKGASGSFKLAAVAKKEESCQGSRPQKIIFKENKFLI